MVNGYAPKTLQEALEIRAAENVTPYAGGTDLMVQDRKGVTYLFLNQLDELKQIADDGAYIRIGAGVTFTQAIASDLVPPLMKEAVSRIAAPAIRNAGTFGGNLGNSSDKADSVLVEVAMGAQVRMASIRGERVIPVEEFFIKRRENDLHDDELIAEILLPKDKCLMPYYYQKVGGRNSLAISHVAIAGLCDSRENYIHHISAAVIADAGVFLHFTELESLEGKSLWEAQRMKDELLAACEQRFHLTRGRVTAQYRKIVSLNLLRDFLNRFAAYHR